MTIFSESFSRGAAGEAVSALNTSLTLVTDSTEVGSYKDPIPRLIADPAGSGQLVAYQPATRYNASSGLGWVIPSNEVTKVAQVDYYVENTLGDNPGTVVSTGELPGRLVAVLGFGISDIGMTGQDIGYFGDPLAIGPWYFSSFQLPNGAPHQLLRSAAVAVPMGHWFTVRYEWVGALPVTTTRRVTQGSTVIHQDTYLGEADQTFDQSNSMPPGSRFALFQVSTVLGNPSGLFRVYMRNMYLETGRIMYTNQMGASSTDSSTTTFLPARRR